MITDAKFRVEDLTYVARYVENYSFYVNTVKKYLLSRNYLILIRVKVKLGS